MDNEFKIISLFPVNIYSGFIPNEYSYLAPILHSQEMGSVGDVDNFGHRSVNSKVLNINELKPIHDYILNQVKVYASKVLNINSNNYIFTQSWISIKYQNQHHQLHSHSNSLISGVFYFGKTDNETPQIAFCNPQQSNHYLLQPEFKNNINPQDTPSFMETTPGKMYMFPSYLPHFVPPNPSPLPRKSLSFNIIPKEGFGIEKNLNELKL